MKNNYTKRLFDVLQYSREEAVRLQSSYIGPEHLMLGILRDGNGIAYDTLAELDVNLSLLKKKIEQNLKNSFDDSFDHSEIAVTKETERVLRMSMLEAKLFKKTETGTEHLLLAILKDANNTAASVLLEENVDYRTVYNMLVNGTGMKRLEEESDEIRDGYTDDDDDEDDDNFGGKKESGRSSGGAQGSAQPKSPNDTPVLDNFGSDMTRAAMENRLDPIVGREKEIERLAQILSRRKKNNPVLIGEPGVGKSAIVEGLALRIVQRKVSRILFDKRVISLDMASVVAGTKYRGQFEERIKAILNELSKNPNIILFIDEIHTLVGAGAASGSCLRPPRPCFSRPPAAWPDPTICRPVKPVSAPLNPWRASYDPRRMRLCRPDRTSRTIRPDHHVGCPPLQPGIPDGSRRIGRARADHPHSGRTASQAGEARRVM